MLTGKFHPSPSTSPEKYSLSGINCGIQENFMDLEIISYPTGVPRAAGRGHGRVIKFWNYLVCKLDLMAVQKRQFKGNILKKL